MKVLCTSVGNDGFPAVLDALRMRAGIRVIGCDSDPLSAGLNLADRGVVIPPRRHSAELLLALQRVVLEESIDVILPLSTEDQDFYSKNKELIEGFGVKLAIGSVSSIAIANDKHALYQHCVERGFPVPRFSICETSAGLVEGLLAYQQKGKLSVIKLSSGTGAQGVKIVDPYISARSRFWSRDNIRLSVVEAIDWAKSDEFFGPVMLSDYLPGRHVSVDAFLTGDGRFFGCCRTEERHLYGMGTAGVVVNEPRVLEVSELLGRDLGLSFCYNVEFKADAEGLLKILEINPRFAASVGHTVAAGLNLPLLSVDEALGNVCEGLEPMRLNEVEYRRYWSGLVV